MYVDIISALFELTTLIWVVLVIINSSGAGLSLCSLSQDRDALSLKLEDTEVWLYEDGEDQPKQVYIDKLVELKVLNVFWGLSVMMYSLSSIMKCLLLNIEGLILSFYVIDTILILCTICIVKTKSTI